ncbi:tyrosine/serine/threonine protein phosphatase pps1 [Parahypoxylon ruwenzoriense]
MTTVALPRPVPPHRSSSGIVTLSPIALETINAQQVSNAPPAPLPNKHLPVCPTGPAPQHVRESTTPPSSPPRRQNESRRSSILHPPDKFERLEAGSLSVFRISPGDVAAALDHLSRQPLPDPSQVFPWFHGLHPSNHIQQTFFMSRSKAVKHTPNCLRGVTVVKADGDLTTARLKGAIAPHEFLQPDSGEFIEVDPKEGFSVRNFQIQAAKTAITSDIVVYGSDAGLVRKLGWETASAQLKWRHRHESQRSPIPRYNTFVCIAPFSEFETKYTDIVAVGSEGRLTGNVIDFFHQERLEMYAMTKATEISHNVWLGPTPEPAGQEEQSYDVLIECSDLGRLNPAALQAIAEGSVDNDDDVKHPYLDFPSSGSILPPTWSHAEADGILDTCKWIWHLSHGTLPLKSDMTDVDGDSNMSDASEATEVELHTRPRKILIHCADGYTESTMLGIAYFSYSTGRPVPAAWLDLHTVMKRNFFAYPTDVSLLTSITPRLLHESPACADKSLSEITAMVKREPRWLAALDGSFPSRVLDYMYLGNLGHANNPDLLKAMGIRQILSVGETAMWRDGELEDWGTENVLVVEKVQDNGIDPLTKEFEKCLEFIGMFCVPLPFLSFTVFFWVQSSYRDMGPERSTPLINPGLPIIDRGRRNGTATLVHCRVGVSRSATICIAEVMRALNLSFPRAYCFVRARRLNVIIQPHLRFAYELLKWEEMLQARRRCGSSENVQQSGGVFSGIKRELEWGEIAREIALMNRPYAR